MKAERLKQSNDKSSIKYLNEGSSDWVLKGGWAKKWKGDVG